MFLDPVWHSNITYTCITRPSCVNLIGSGLDCVKDPAIRPSYRFADTVHGASPTDRDRPEDLDCSPHILASLSSGPHCTSENNHHTRWNCGPYGIDTVLQDVLNIQKYLQYVMILGTHFQCAGPVSMAAALQYYSIAAIFTRATTSTHWIKLSSLSQSETPHATPFWVLWMRHLPAVSGQTLINPLPLCGNTRREPFSFDHEKSPFETSVTRLIGRDYHDSTPSQLKIGFFFEVLASQTQSMEQKVRSDDNKAPKFLFLPRYVGGFCVDHTW